MEVISLKPLLVLLCYVLPTGETWTIKSPGDETNSAETAFRTGDESTTVMKGANVTDILGQTFNFSYLVEPTDTVQLTIANQTINLSAFTVDKSNAGSLQRMLEEHSLSDIMYIATKIARIEKKIADKVNRTLESLALEKIFDPDDDIVLTREDVDKMESEINQGSKSTRRKRKALKNKLWPTTIPYSLSSVFDEYIDGKIAIKEGIRHWEEETCLRFQEEQYDGGANLRFIMGEGCSSYVGRQPNGQEVSIARGCATKGVVAHEIAHALGFWHEHSRPDRNKYVTVHYDNIKGGMSHNFYSKTWGDAQTMGIPYDYSSLMHYDSKAFSRNGGKTITAKETDLASTIGSRDHLSFYDVKLANLIYCNSECEGGLLWERCSYEGYKDPKDCNRCKCPDGLSGDFCTSVKPGKRANCGNAELVASSEWQTLTSPNYGVIPYHRFSECSWRIKSSGSFKRIVVRFEGRFSFPCNIPCLEYVEVRHVELSRAGPRYCCDSTPTGQIVSHGSEMLILMRANTGLKFNGFALKYKTEPCGGCSSSTSTSGPPCVDTQPYACQVSYTERCGNWWTRCTRYKTTTCYKQVKTCCPGFTLSGDTCTRKFFNIFKFSWYICVT